ncbi:YtcA family lipoprotein [Paraburkholderia sp. DD10]|uniref:YtcA family lipoprotein n=2 Tax=Burkholderiaceae TaxID=119060 RepID=UPI003A0DD277
MGRPERHVSAIATLGVSLQGCTLRGAPSYEIFGGYFPLWLVSAIVGLAGALIVHRVFLATGWTRVVPLQLFVCVAAGLTVAVLFWLAGTGQLL